MDLVMVSVSQQMLVTVTLLWLSCGVSILVFLWLSNLVGMTISIHRGRDMSLPPSRFKILPPISVPILVGGPNFPFPAGFKSSWKSTDLYKKILKKRKI